MDAVTLSKAMGNALPLARYEALAPAFNACLIAAGCTTVPRVAMLSCQVGHEAGGLRYMREIWGPTAAQRGYEGRRDLGNTQPGDGQFFAGVGPLQITGRANVTAVSKWAHSKGYVPTPTYFVERPWELAGDRYGFLGVVWYWTVARPRLNALADAGDVVGATRLVNGGTNGLADRQKRYAACLKLGAALLPTGGGDMPLTNEDLIKIRDIVWQAPIPDTYTPNPNDTLPAYLSLAYATSHPAFARDRAVEARGAAVEARDAARLVHTELATLRTALAATTKGSGQPLTADDIARLLREALAEVGPLYLTGRAPAA